MKNSEPAINARNNSQQESGWKTLYKIGGAAAIAVAAFIPIQIIVYMISPPAETAAGAFALFRNNMIMGLLSYDLLLMIDYILSILVYLAIYIAIRKINPSLMAIGITLGITGIAIFYASNPAFQLLNLSNQYAAATTEIQKAAIIAAGEGMLSNFTGSSFNVSYILGAIAVLLFSIVMLRSDIFSKKTAYIGLVAAVLMFIPPSAGIIGIYFSLLSLIPTFIWLILVSSRLLKLE